MLFHNSTLLQYQEQTTSFTSKPQMGKANSKNMKLKHGMLTYKHSVFLNLPGILIKVQRTPSCLPLLLVSSSSVLLALSLSSACRHCGHQGTRMSQQVPAQAEHSPEVYREIQVNLGTHGPEPHCELRIQLGIYGS